MSDRADKNAPDAGTKPGAVKHDSRGNAVWQWAVDTGKHALDSTSALLRRLEMPGLTLEGDKPPEKKAEAKDSGEVQLEVQKHQGYDPYGRAKQRGAARPSAPAGQPAAGAGSAPAPRAPKSPPPAARGEQRPLSPHAPAPEAPRASWLGRLFGRR